MKYLGWYLLIAGVAFHWKAASYYEQKILDMRSTLNIISNGKKMEIDLINKVSEQYELCLGREKKLQSFFRRKVSNYRQIAKLNKERMKVWLKREKPLIQAHYSQHFRELAGLEKLMIPYKWEYLTSLDVTQVPFMVSKLKL